MIITGALLQLLGMGALGSFLLFIAWTQLFCACLAQSRGAGWRFDKALLIRLGVALITAGTTTMCYNRASVVLFTHAPPPGPLLLQFVGMIGLVLGAMTLLWVAGIGKRVWAFALFWAGSSAWAAFTLFWTLGYVGV
jgi:hypothetical protein